MSARQLLADALSIALPDDLRLLAYARDLDQPDQSTVMLRLDEVRRSPAADGALEHDFALILVARQTAAGGADDELDAVLADVLHVLQTTPLAIRWEKATRAVFASPEGTPKFPCFEITTTIATTTEEP